MNKVDALQTCPSQTDDLHYSCSLTAKYSKSDVRNACLTDFTSTEKESMRIQLHSKEKHANPRDLPSEQPSLLKFAQTRDQHFCLQQLQLGISAFYKSNSKFCMTAGLRLTTTDKPNSGKRSRKASGFNRKDQNRITVSTSSASIQIKQADTSVDVRIQLNPLFKITHSRAVSELLAMNPVIHQLSGITFAFEDGQVVLQISLAFCKQYRKAASSSRLAKYADLLESTVPKISDCVFRHIYLREHSSTITVESSSDVISGSEAVYQEVCLLNFLSSNSKLASFFELSVDANETLSELRYVGPVEHTLRRAIYLRSLRPTTLKAVMQMLLDLYSENVQFKNFPGSHILLLPGHSLKIRGFGLSSLIDPCSAMSQPEYKRKMQRELNRFLAETQKNNFALLSNNDFLPLSEFQFPIEEGDILGRGGHGIVYKNYYNGSAVAIKLPLGTKESLPEGSQRIQREYHYLKALKHPHVIKAFGLIKYRNCYGLVTEYCETTVGKLHKTTNSHDDYSFKNCLLHLHQSAQAIEYIQSRGVSHFDMKPGNCFLKTKDHAVIADFGLARFTDCEAGVQSPGYTLLYASPEQLASKPESFRKRSDVWSFGVTMLVLLAKQQPYANAGITKQELRRELLVKKGTPTISEEFEVAHPQLAALMKQCWLRCQQRITIQCLREGLGRFIR